MLTDRLTCPRCGPTFGLILLAERMVDRRVRDGTLGCPNCRDAFPVVDGFADLRAPPRRPVQEDQAGRQRLDPRLDPGPRTDEEGRDAEGLLDQEAEGADGWSAEPDRDAAEADRLVALLGIERGPGTVALVGRPARFAVRVARSVDDLHVVAVDRKAVRWPDVGSVTRMVAAPGLPFFSRTLRGVVVDGTLGGAMLREAARVTAPMARVVVTIAPPDAEDVLEDAGLTVLAADAGTVVAARG